MADTTLFKIRQPDGEKQNQAYRDQRAKGKSEIYARAFANKIHEGETFARYFAELRCDPSRKAKVFHYTFRCFAQGTKGLGFEGHRQSQS